MPVVFYRLFTFCVKRGAKMRQFISNSTEETEAFAAALAEKIGGAAVIAMTGDLGAGKTPLCEALQRAWALPARFQARPLPLFTNTSGEDCRFTISICTVLRIGIPFIQRAFSITWKQNRCLPWNGAKISKTRYPTTLLRLI